MKITVEVDEVLLKQAMICSSISNEQQVLESGLKLLIKTLAQTGIRKLRGKVAWEGILD